MLAGRIVRTSDLSASPAQQVWRRRAAKSSRWLHIYVSMVSCIIVLFFAVTGITLNHPEWFADTERTTQVAGQLEMTWMRAGTADVARFEVVEYLRRIHGLRGAVGDVVVDDQQVALSFLGPGYLADVLVDRTTGMYEVTETRLGLVAIANDLHKGRDSGPVWKAGIDLSAALLALISLSGLAMLYFMHRHRVTGFVLLGLGGLATYGVYFFWVP
jgi:hypothetical protein